MVLLVAGAIAFCMVFLMERYEKEEWVGASQEALRNPYLAAERFLSDRGVKVIKTTDTIDFSGIPHNHTLLLTDIDSILVSPRQIEEALEWINAGGYLIAGVGREIEGQSSLLKRFDIEPSEIELQVDDLLIDVDDEKTLSEQLKELNEKIEQEASEQESVEDGPNSKKEKRSVNSNKNTNDLFNVLYSDYRHEYFKLNLTEGEPDLNIAVLDQIVLNHELLSNSSDDSQEDQDNEHNQYKQNGYTLNAWRHDDFGQRLLQFYYGDGTFIALSSSKHWTNDNIGLGDHAHFLSYLVPDDATLQLFYNLQAPSLFSLINKYFKETVWSSAALLLFWLWMHGMRVQRERLTTPNKRREFSEHLRSAAGFLMRHKKSTTLVQTLKEDIEQQMLGHYPNFRSLNETTQATILSEKTQLSTSNINSWFAYCKEIKTPDQLVAAVQLGKAIRKML